MIELKDKSANYAAGKANEAIDKVIAQAYADGYRDGYADCEKDIPVNLHDPKSTNVDLGLPSGTLWSSNYDKEDDEYVFSPYEKAVMYDIPTIEQWNELVVSCKWDYVTNSAGTLLRIDCTGPNGRVISFYVTGQICAIQKKSSNESFFWVKQEMDGTDRKAVHMSYQKKTTYQGCVYYNEVKVAEDTFSGYKLPIRLVRKK